MRERSGPVFSVRHSLVHGQAGGLMTSQAIFLHQALCTCCRLVFAPPTRQDFLASFTSPRVHSTCLHMRMSGRTVAGHGACHARIAILRADRRGANSCESFIHGGIDFIFATPLQVDGSCENAEQHDLHRTQVKLTGQLVHETADESSRFSLSRQQLWTVDWSFC